MEDSTNKHYLRKKLFVAPDFRSSRRGRRIPVTFKLTIIRRTSLLVAVTINRARSTRGNEEKAATEEPGPSFLLVGRPANTGLGRFFGRATGTAPLLLVLTTCVDIGAGARHSASRYPVFLQQNQIIVS